MSELHNALLGPIIALVLLLAACRWPRHLAEAPRWAVLIYILPFAIACLFTFPSLDDWCYGASGQRGWWAAQQEWYQGWSGRILTTALLTTWGNLGSPWFAAVCSYRIVVTVVFCTTCWAIWDLISVLEPTVKRNERVTLSCGMIAGWLCLLKDPAEGVYWLPGVASYTLGAVLSVISCSSLLRAHNGSPYRWWLALLSLVGACLCGEVVAGLALTLFALVSIFFLSGSNLVRSLVLLAAGIGASLLVLLAPGNAIRSMAAVSEGQQLVDHSITALFLNTTNLLIRFITDTTWAPLTAFAAWVAWRSPKHQVVLGVCLLCVIPCIVLVAALPMAWAGMSPARAWNPLALSCSILVILAGWRGGTSFALPLLFITGLSFFHSCAPDLASRVVPICCWLVVAGVAWLLRIQFRQILIPASLTCALFIGSERFGSAVAQVFGGPQYWTEQQARMAILSQAEPNSDVKIPRLSGVDPLLFHLDDIRLTSQAWPNQGCAAFFGLRSVRTQVPVASLVPRESEAP